MIIVIVLIDTWKHLFLNCFAIKILMPDQPERDQSVTPRLKRPHKLTPQQVQVIPLTLDLMPY